MEWISVKDRLPEVRVIVVGYTNRKRTYLTCVNTGSLELDRHDISTDDDLEEKFTHWMPLPEPPKE